MKVSFVVTLDAQDVPDSEVTAEQVEAARAIIHRAVTREVNTGIHVTTTVQSGLPLHPFKRRHPLRKP